MKASFDEGDYANRSRPFPEKFLACRVPAGAIDFEWAQANPAEVVSTLAPQFKVEPKVLALATERRQYGAVALTPAIAREQQGLADVFAQLKLIPKPIEIQNAFLDLNLV